MFENGDLLVTDGWWHRASSVFRIQPNPYKSMADKGYGHTPLIQVQMTDLYIPSLNIQIGESIKIPNNIIYLKILIVLKIILMLKMLDLQKIMRIIFTQLAT